MVKPDRYRVYVLRMWPVQRGGLPQWHISLENVSTGERERFLSLEDLFLYFERELSSAMRGFAEVEEP